MQYLTLENERWSGAVLSAFGAEQEEKEMVREFAVAWPEEEREMQQFLTLPSYKKGKVFLAPLTPI